MESRKDVQHVYLVGAKSLGAYGGYETFVYKLTEHHQNKKNIKYHVACKANGDGCMDETKFDGAVLEAYAKQFNITKLKRIITGGATGQESIYNGLKAIKEDNEETKDIVVVIHDGNRPMLPQDVITDNLVKQKLFGFLPLKTRLYITPKRLQKRKTGICRIFTAMKENRVLHCGNGMRLSA